MAVTKLTLRLPDALRDRLKATAGKECISLNALIVRVLSGLQGAPKAGGKGWTLVTPKCEKCNMEMSRYEDAPDTGRGGWSCDYCGRSMDDCPQWNPDAPKEGK